jgi:hypothetical protein
MVVGFARSIEGISFQQRACRNFYVWDISRCMAPIMADLPSVAGTMTLRPFFCDSAGCRGLISSGGPAETTMDRRSDALQDPGGRVHGVDRICGSESRGGGRGKVKLPDNASVEVTNPEEKERMSNNDSPLPHRESLDCRRI